MWRQLSGSQKFRFVCEVIGLLAGILGFILCVMTGNWVRAALTVFWTFACVSDLNKLATGGRDTGAP